jgi:hypothetical protein
VQVPEPVLQQLEALISSLIGQSSTFGTAVLTSEHLLKILDVFRGLRKVVLCKVRAVVVVVVDCCTGVQSRPARSYCSWHWLNIYFHGLLFLITAYNPLL